jgi:hypothetical protein
MMEVKKTKRLASLMRIMFLPAVAAALSFGANATFADGSGAMVPFTLSGTLCYTTNNGARMNVPIKTTAFNAQSLIKLLNASTNATNTLQAITGTNHIPAGSSFLWSFYGDEAASLFITNKNGFFFPLSGASYNYGSLELYGQSVGTYNLIPKTSGGTEKDVFSFTFFFYDGNGPQNENQIQLDGTANFSWYYIASETNVQTTIFGFSMSGVGPGANGSYVDGYIAVPKTFYASGGASWSIYTNYVPFYDWWNND